MRNLQQYIAYLLLVLLFRVLMPEDAILLLHAHQHTEDKVQAEATVGTMHIHCEVDDYCGNFFLAPHFSYDLALAPQSGCYIQPYDFVWKFTFPNNTYLRGPPVA
ncbi:hypothetical protein GCM10027443_25670 [Pontibacter brevis]